MTSLLFFSSFARSDLSEVLEESRATLAITCEQSRAHKPMSNSKLNGLFGNSKKYNKPSGPPEPCELNVGDNQVVKAIIPHGTPRAAAIRELLKTQVLNGEGARIFYWHEEHDAWTNDHFKSTASNPLLGAPPVEAVEKAYDVFNKSSAVSAVKITDEEGEILTLQQVKAMRFTSLEESAIAEPEEEEEVDEVADAVVELQSAVASLACANPRRTAGKSVAPRRRGAGPQRVQGPCKACGW